MATNGVGTRRKAPPYILLKTEGAPFKNTQLRLHATSAEKRVRLHWARVAGIQSTERTFAEARSSNFVLYLLKVDCALRLHAIE